MTEAAAFQAVYTDWSLIKGRKVVRIGLEIPIEQADLAYQALGGMPNPAESAWVAVARLNPERAAPRTHTTAAPAAPEPEPPGRSKTEKRLAQQAGILCDDIRFQRFLSETGWADIDPAAAVRSICEVDSRSQIIPGTEAAKLWHDLVGQYEHWKTA